MFQNKKVSIIVPVYKVEKYIHRCIDSILNQTYDNIEIILVDDGSPDHCWEIVDEYEKTDRRIKVIHKENGGLSDARNVGVNQVSGDFVFFVDSDDWVEKTMIEKMVDSCDQYQADVVQSAFYYAYEDKRLLDNRYYSTTDLPVILGKKTLMRELVTNEKVKNFAWGKLYKTNIIKDIAFKKGVLFEDVFWAHQVMHEVNTYVILHEPLYNYYQRSDSIVATYTPKNLDILKGLLERHCFIEKHYKELTDSSYKTILKMSLIHYNLLLMNRKKDPRSLHRKEIRSYIHNNYDNLKKAVKKDKLLEQQLQLFSLHPYLNFIYLGLRKGLRMMKFISQPVGLEQQK
ncbi:glycosyltransferase family 2 protein [Peribacillus sp. FSL H8-0477]|uniref:glycosyltransferase family 2 protein n=1 Tax=Peribacillus sp. FSL H8-0477 TaxID=2921388 RepID=UPI0030FA3C12